MRRFVLGIAVAVTTLMPTIGMADDQQIADFIKSRLQSEQQQGNLRGFNVDMKVDRGTVWFKGHVSNSNQETTILKAAQSAGHLGVVQVVDDIEIQTAEQSVFDSDSAFRTASYQQPSAPVPAVREPQFKQASNQEFVESEIASSSPLPFADSNMPMASGYSSEMSAGNYGGEVVGPSHNRPTSYNAGPAYGAQTAGEMSGGPAYSVAAAPAPMPVSYGSAGGPTGAPNLPGYAWPGYAAHPNYGAVSYPQQYSPSAWPYIGPFYPYPQVPLGWRKVTLEWDDGWWQLDFHDK